MSQKSRLLTLLFCVALLAGCQAPATRVVTQSHQRLKRRNMAQTTQWLLHGDFGD